MTETGDTLDWNSLTSDQQRVMMSGIERHLLSDVLIFWANREDVEHSNRGYKYVPPLMEAAKFLIEKGLLTVVPNQRPPQELSATSALEIVSDFDNWWVYNPEMSADDVEDNGVDPMGRDTGSTIARDYVLTDTNHAGYSIVNWAPPTSMDHAERVGWSGKG
jgi:hypothetical protein